MALLTWLKVFGVQAKRRLLHRRSFTFLFFLLLASIFWLITMLDEVSEQNFSVRFLLKNVPENVIVSGDSIVSVDVKLRDKAGVLLAYRYGEEIPIIEVEYAKYVTSNGNVVVPTLDLLRPMVQKLKGNTTIVGIGREFMEYTCVKGQKKRVPVRFNGQMPDDDYMIAGFVSAPDSVEVYATPSVLSGIEAAYIEGTYDRSDADTVKWRGAITSVPGAKFTPSEVDFTLFYDRPVEKTVKVPVRKSNFPASKDLRTFPSHVTVRFRVGMNSYRNVTADNFTILVKYDDLLKHKDNRIRLSIQSLPPGVKHAQIEPAEVEFVVENLPESE